MILEDLWSGRFYPAETVVPTSPEYREVNREISKKMEWNEIVSGSKCILF